MIQTENKEITLESLKREEIELLHDYIIKMARYEKLEDEVTSTPKILEDTIFNKNAAKVYFVRKNNETIGFVLFGLLMSTFTGKPTLYLEDIYIDEQERGNGYGKLIFSELTKLAVKNDYGRMDWQCLDWNTPSINFYLSMNAKRMEGWSMYRLDEEGLKSVSKK